MITTENFHALIHRAIGNRMMSVGKKYSEMVHSKGRFMHLLYDEIEIFKEIAENDDVDIHDGEEWLTVFAYDKNDLAPEYGR